MNSENTPQYLLSSVDNALKLLLLFKQRPQVRLSEAREYLGVGQSTAHRLLAMLVYRGFVTQDPATRIYMPGRALLELGLAALKQQDIQAVARPMLEELARDLNETTALGMLQGASLRLIDGVEPDRSLRVPMHVGRIVPAHATSAGKALLAALSQQQFYELYPEETLEKLTEGTITSRAQLEVELEQIRKMGYATNIDESDEGLSSLAVVIHHPSKGAIAAISVLAPSLRVDQKRTPQVVKHVELACKMIEQRLASEQE